MVINKQAGIVTHPAPGNETGTLVQALLYHGENQLSDIYGNNKLYKKISKAFGLQVGNLLLIRLCLL